MVPRGFSHRSMGRSNGGQPLKRCCSRRQTNTSDDVGKSNDVCIQLQVELAANIEFEWAYAINIFKRAIKQAPCLRW